MVLIITTNNLIHEHMESASIFIIFYLLASDPSIYTLHCPEFRAKLGLVVVRRLIASGNNNTLVTSLKLTVEKILFIMTIKDFNFKIG